MKHYLTYTEPKPIGNGLVRQFFSTVPVRYLDGDEYRDIDLNLTNAGGIGYENLRLPFKCIMPKRANGEILYRNLKHEVSFRALCNPVEGEQREPHVVYYPDAFGEGCSLEIQAGAPLLRKNVVIERRPAAVADYLEFRFEVNFRNVPEPEMNRLFHDTVALYDGEENVSYFRKTLCKDAHGTLYRLPISFVKECGRAYLVKRIPRAVLERCAYPLRFDDTITPIAHTADGWCYNYQKYSWSSSHDAASSEAVYNTADTFTVVNGKPDSCWRLSRAFVCFDTSALPDNIPAAMISAINLWLTVDSRTNTSYINCVRSFQASPTTLAQADFEDCGSDATETGARAKYTPQITYATSNYTISSTGLKCIVFDNTLKSRIATTAGLYTQIGIRQSYDIENVSNTTYRVVDFVSSNAASNQPTLQVDYQNGLFIPTQAETTGIGTTAEGCLKTRCSGTVDTVISLGWEITDADGNFIVNGVAVGDIITNTTTRKCAAVLSRTVTNITFAEQNLFTAGNAYRIDALASYDRLTTTDFTNMINAASGGLGVGGTCSVEQSVSWLVSQNYNTVIIGTQMKEITAATASSQSSAWPATNLMYPQQPRKAWRSNVTTESWVDITFESGVDAVALVNCNFTNFTLTVVGSTSPTVTGFADVVRNSYTGLATLNKSGNGGKEISKVRITIPAQTIYFGETYFRIGSVIGFKTVDSFPVPLYPVSKKLIENVSRRTFDGGNEALMKLGEPYFVSMLSFPRLTEADLLKVQELERLCDVGGYIFIAESYSDYTFRCLCQLADNLKYELVAPYQYSASLLLKEVI